MVLEILVLLGWMAIATGCCWLVWRTAYAQGVSDARVRSCCSGGEEHEHPLAPSSPSDELDAELERILAGRH